MAVIIPGSLPWSFLCTEHPCPRCLLDRLLQLCSNVTTEMRPTPHAKFNNVNCAPPNALCFSVSHSALTSPLPPQHISYLIMFIICAFLLDSDWASRERAQGASSLFCSEGASCAAQSGLEFTVQLITTSHVCLSVCPSRLHLLSIEITEYTSTPHST